MLNYPNIEKALHFIDEHLAQEITLTRISDVCGMSKYHFARTFKAVTGMTFKTYHNRKRIETARKMLETRGMRITDVCFEVGFNDVSYFNRVFRRFAGMSPLAYQKECFPAGGNNGRPVLRNSPDPHG